MTAADTDRLRVEVKEEPRCHRVITVSVPAEVVERERSAVTREYAGKMKLKGFRRGRIPAAVLAKQFGPAIEREAADKAVQESLHKAIRVS